VDAPRFIHVRQRQQELQQVAQSWIQIVSTGLAFQFNLFALYFFTVSFLCIASCVLFVFRFFWRRRSNNLAFSALPFALRCSCTNISTALFVFLPCLLFLLCSDARFLFLLRLLLLKKTFESQPILQL